MATVPKARWPRLALWGVTVRDSFIVLLPLTFLGVAATLLGNLPFVAMHGLMDRVFGAGWQAVTQNVVHATYGVFSLALAMVVSIRLAHRLPVAEGDEALPTAWVGIAAMVNFMLCLISGGQPTLAALGHDSMLLGIVIGLATPELLRPLAALAVMRRMAPDYTSEPAFYHAVRMTPPLMVASLAVMLTAKAAKALPPLVAQWLATLAPLPPGWTHVDWVLDSAAVLVNQSLWFVGIHGGKVLDQHAQAFFGATGAAYDPSLAWRPLIDTFVHLGGSGATLGLVLALLIVVREGPFQRVAHASLLPAVFNINELLIFGLPIALNPVFLLPFLLAPLALTLLALAAAHTGLLPLHNLVVPWTTPPLLSGYLLSDSWRGVAFQLLGLLLSTLIYLPFARRAEAWRARGQKDAFYTATRAIAAQSQLGARAVQHDDQVGLIARGLFAALTRDIGTAALTLAFQPKHGRDGAVVGVEALLRWTHRRHGPISADVAVTLAEEGGLIRRLGVWVLEEACARKAQWNRLGLSHITMAINVSPLQLGDPQLPALLARCLVRHGLTPDQIELEITESHAIPVHQVVDQNLAQLVDMGVSLAMDDFGMGHSSLLYMRRFSVHAIKIDGSLTRDVLTNPAGRDIVRTITALGHARRVEVVAEFVETAEQRDVLAALGCEVFQGYLYSPPLPAADCAEYLRANGVSRGSLACAAGG